MAGWVKACGCCCGSMCTHQDCVAAEHVLADNHAPAGKQEQLGGHGSARCNTVITLWPSSIHSCPGAAPAGNVLLRYARGQPAVHLPLHLPLDHQPT